MKKLSTFACMAILAAAPAFAQDVTPEVVKITPPIGEATNLGTPEVEFNLLPSVNKNCSETAKFYFNDELVGELLPTSYKVQMGVEGQPENAAMFSFVNRPMNDLGKYRFELPAGFFTFSGGSQQNAAYTAEWTISPKVAFTVNPAPGYYTQIPNSATLVFQGAKEIVVNKLEKNSDGRGVILFDTPAEFIEPEIIVMGNRVVLNYPANAPYTVKGTYLLDIPSGAFNITMDDGTIMTNGQKLIYYYIPIIPYPSIEPAQGEIESIETVKLYFTEEDKALFRTFNRPPSIFTSNDAGDIGDMVGTFSEDGKQFIKPIQLNNSQSVTLMLGKPVYQPGKYVVKINKASFSAQLEGYIDTNGEVQPYAYNDCQYLYYFTIPENPAQIAFNGDQTNNQKTVVRELDQISFSLPNAGDSQITLDSSKAELCDDWGDPIAAQVTLLLEETRAGSSIVAKIDPALTQAGDYILTLGKGAVKVGDKYNPPFSLNIKIDPSYTAISAVDETPALLDVYRIDGTVAARQISADQLKDLPKGLYIVGKKKMIIR